MGRVHRARHVRAPEKSASAHLRAGPGDGAAGAALRAAVAAAAFARGGGRREQVHLPLPERPAQGDPPGPGRAAAAAAATAVEATAWLTRVALRPLRPGRVQRGQTVHRDAARPPPTQAVSCGDDDEKEQRRSNGVDAQHHVNLRAGRLDDNCGGVPLSSNFSGPGGGDGIGNQPSAAHAPPGAWVSPGCASGTPPFCAASSSSAPVGAAPAPAACLVARARSSGERRRRASSLSAAGRGAQRGLVTSSRAYPSDARRKCAEGALHGGVMCPRLSTSPRAASLLRAAVPRATEAVAAWRRRPDALICR